MRLGVNVRHAEEQLRGTLALPNGLGKSITVAVFAEGDGARAATEAGADFVGAQDLADRVEEGWTDFDVAIATPALMGPVVSKLGRVLGPQGKMPNPKVGTVTDDVKTAVREFKAGKIEFRNDAAGNVQATVGKLSFNESDLRANIDAFIEHIKALKPATVKGTYIQNASVSATMSPGIMLAVQA